MTLIATSLHYSLDNAAVDVVEDRSLGRPENDPNGLETTVQPRSDQLLPLLIAFVWADIGAVGATKG
jgi:hypothetical protein